MHNPCVNNGTCIDGIKDYSCKCYTGYTGNNAIILKLNQLNYYFYNRKKLWSWYKWMW